MSARFGYIVGRLQRALNRHLEARLRPLGVTSPQYTLLSVLRARPGLTNAQLARRAMITPQSMHRIMLVLEARGLIVRPQDASHHAERRAKLTPAGEAMLDACEGAVCQLEARMLAGLPETERARFQQLLLRISRRLDAG